MVIADLAWGVTTGSGQQMVGKRVAMRRVLRGDVAGEGCGR